MNTNQIYQRATKQSELVGAELNEEQQEKLKQQKALLQDIASWNEHPMTRKFKEQLNTEILRKCYLTGIGTINLHPTNEVIRDRASEQGTLLKVLGMMDNFVYDNNPVI